MMIIQIELNKEHSENIFSCSLEYFITFGKLFKYI
jgi:hypothetical protein